MSAGVIAVGHNYIKVPDFRAAFDRVMAGHGGDLPEPPRVWNASDYYTPVLHFVDKFVF